MSRYTYGVSDLAAKRLEAIAKVFNPPAVSFIRTFVENPVQSGIDLGCGPGFTTRMLSEALQCNKIFGLDITEHFLSLAKGRFPQFQFLKHDVTRTPFPVKAEVIYSRLLLSHLPSPVALVNRWTRELPPKGLLFIEEIESIETGIPVFQKYLAANEGLVASQGAELSPGKTLAAGQYDCRVICNEGFTLPVANRDAASWFYPNTITIWEAEEYIRNCLSETERREISAELLEITNAPDDRSEITWQVRRLVFGNIS